MRELSEGPDLAWGFWGWVHHDGSTWATLGFDGHTVTADRMIGWAGMTMQIDNIPVIGVYIDPPYRGARRAEALLGTLLRALVAAEALAPGATVAAATGRWSRYEEVVGSCGLRCVTWGE